MPSGSEESHLARAAAAGDGPAFACLYEAYERRIFNFLFRLLGDRHEAEDATQDAFLKVLAKLPDLDLENLQFGPYLYTAARNVGYDVIARRKRLEPTGAVPEQAEAPFRGELSDLETDPERSALADSQEEAVQAANQRLPERQREVLALRELDGMSYDEIGSVMEMNSNSVAQLISRARISLRKEMRAGAAASVALASPDCERAHGEIACRQDGQPGGPDDQWLVAHLASCANCRVAGEEMAEAGVSYRAWAPAVPAAWLFREVMAKASEATGFDWGEVERPEPGDAPEGTGAGAAPPGRGGGKRAALVGLGSLILAGILATVLMAEADAPERVGAVRDSFSKPSVDPKRKAEGKPAKRLARRKKRPASEAVAAEPSVTTTSAGTPAAQPGSTNSPPSAGKPNTGGGNSSGPSRPNPTPTPKPADPVPETPPRPVPEPETPPPDRDPPCVPVPGGPPC